MNGYIKRIVKGVMRWVTDEWEALMIAFGRRIEIKKFKDPRRIKIQNEYPLSKEQKEEIDRFYLENYGKKIDYCWHQNYAAHSGRFDYKYFPELLFIPEFERFENQDKAMVSVVSDKNILPIFAKAAGVRMPRTIVACTNGIYKDDDFNILSEAEALDRLKQTEGFIKPSVDSCSGEGCMLFSGKDILGLKNGILRICTGGGYNIEYKKDFVVQERLVCHESIRAIYPKSVNTFRVISYIWHNEIKIMPVIMRIGQGGGVVDNAHAGGMFVSVSNDGRLGKTAMTEFNDKYQKHPDTGLVFENHQIYNFDKVLQSVRRIHALVTRLGVVNWDFTINQDGEAVLLEANVSSGSIWLAQMAHGKAGFGEDTAEVLRWVRFMEGLPKSKRKEYCYGERK